MVIPTIMKEGHDHHEHHHNHDEAHNHEHHHDHGLDCTCGCHDHAHHDHHHADEVFMSWGRETIKKYNKEELKVKLHTGSARSRRP